MKIKLSIIAILAVAFCAAVPFVTNVQAKGKESTTVTKQVKTGEFSKISASQGIRVVLMKQIYSGVANVKTISDYEQYLKVVNDNGTLRIYYDGIDKINHGGETIVQISTPTLTDIDLSSAATLAFVENFAIDGKLEIEASSASKVVTKKVTCTKLDIDTSSSASVEVAELAGSLEADASSASSIKIGAVKGRNVNAEASSAASITIEKINCENVVAEASSASTVALAGVCSRFSKDVSSAGRVKHSNLAVRKK